MPAIAQIVANLTYMSFVYITLTIKCFRSRDPSLLTRACCTFAGPVLEYCSTIWNPNFKRDINKIESVQRQFTKRLSGLHILSYYI